MSTAIFPTLIGLGWTVKRTALWQTRVQQSISGKRVTMADWSYPRWQWELTYDVLRQGKIGQTTYSELATLAGFFNTRLGRFDTFLYKDADDNGVVGQGIGVTDSIHQTFQIVRAFGGFVEPIWSPDKDATRHVYLNGVEQFGTWDTTDWNQVNTGPSFGPGLLGFTTVPVTGQTITMDFNYKFPCRFIDDSMNFEMFMQHLYAGKSVKFESEK